jgi:DNA-binding NarL/FixJ family response regulator
MSVATLPTRLLLVEDHQMTLMGLELLLQKETDFNVVGKATTGVEALKQAETLHPDVVLMDIGLPEMDGIEATQRLKASQPSTRILMLTSKDNEQDVMAALAAGADGYCMKGIGAESLAAAIRSVAEGAAYLDPAIARLVLGKFQPVGASGQAKTSVTLGQMGASVGAAQQQPSLTLESPLTPRELEVLHLIVEGYSNADIAGQLIITKATAKAHVHSILQKLCVDDRTQAAVLAMRQGLVSG